MKELESRLDGKTTELTVCNQSIGDLQKRIQQMQTQIIQSSAQMEETRDALQAAHMGLENSKKKSDVLQHDIEDKIKSTSTFIYCV
jgi:uncharacterized coiled-coil DUF342 family protein